MISPRAPPRQTAKSADDGDDERFQHEIVTDERIDQIKRHQHRAGECRHCGCERECLNKYPLNRNADQTRTELITGSGANFLAEPGKFQKCP